MISAALRTFNKENWGARVNRSSQQERIEDMHSHQTEDATGIIRMAAFILSTFHQLCITKFSEFYFPANIVSNFSQNLLNKHSQRRTNKQRMISVSQRQFGEHMNSTEKARAFIPKCSLPVHSTTIQIDKSSRNGKPRCCSLSWSTLQPGQFSW